MDKLSAALAAAIGFLVCVNIAVVYTVWFSSEEEQISAASVKQIEEEMAFANIAMNDKSQVINGGSRDMWIRAAVRTPEEKPSELCSLISDTIAEKATPDQLKQGVWVPDRDGYYYYSLPVRPGEQSKRLFTSVTASGERPEGSVRVQAEGVQVNWTGKMAESAKEAFALFRLYQPLQNYKGKFV